MTEKCPETGITKLQRSTMTMLRLFFQSPPSPFTSCRTVNTFVSKLAFVFICIDFNDIFVGCIVGV